MRILSSPHCHTTYVDGHSTAREMVAAAVENNFVSMGFSEHGTQIFDEKYGISKALLPLYISEVRALAAEYRDIIRIHLGIERDRYSTVDRKNFDYILGAYHYLKFDDGFFAADGSFEDLSKCAQIHYGGDGSAMAADFFRMTGDYAAEYKPDIMAHFDLIKKRNGTGALYNPDDARVTSAAYEALEKILASGALLEVNTGGMARSGQKTPYPDAKYLKRWCEMGGRVIVGSDCHNAAQIAYAFDEMPEYLMAAGFKTAWRLGRAGETLFVEYPLT